jgi:hypothetical protein
LNDNPEPEKEKNMQVFQTTRNETQEAADRRKREDSERDAKAREAQIANDNRRAWAAGEPEAIRRQAEVEEERLVTAGNDTVSLLAGLQRRAAELRSAIGNEEELRAIEKEISPLKMQLITMPLTSASPSVLDALNRWRTLAELWETRKALLVEQLALVEQKITDNESAIDKLKNGLGVVKQKLAALAGK